MTTFLLIILLIIALYYLGRTNPTAEELADWIKEKRSESGGFFTELMANFERAMVEDMITRQDYVFFSIFVVSPTRNRKIVIVGIAGVFFPVKS